VHGELFEPLLDRAVFAGKEARPHAVRHGPQAQIDARRLELALFDRLDREDLLRHPHLMLELVRGKYAGGE
jgi:hypothetical protein